MISGYIATDRGDRCPTDICGAVCCRASHFRPDKGPPCEFLTDQLSCELHDAGGIKCKPWGCAEYPKNNADIDSINKQAEAHGFTERCQLRVS